MLGKLFKHEFKATGRHFIIIYSVFFLITLFNKLFLEISVPSNRFFSYFQNIFMIFYVIMCAAIFIITSVLVVYRFYKNLMCDEGYLMFTLPVTIEEHIIVKMITSFVWMVLSTITFFISILILVSGHGFEDTFSQIFDLIREVSTYFQSQFTVFVLIYLCIHIVGTLYNILQYYFALSIGQLVGKHRILASIGAYFAINFVIQNIIGFLFIFTNALNLESYYLIDESEITENIFEYLNTFGLIALALNIALAVFFFFATKIILTKKLNLD